MSSRVLRPGLALGHYPERKREPENRLEAIAHATSGLWRRLGNGALQRALQFCRQVEQQSDGLSGLDEAEFAQQVSGLRQQLLRAGLREDLLPRSFALVREAAARAIGQRHYDTQIAGGWILLAGMLAEMETGEGKSLTATLPACTAALAGIPVHIITANDYLVERDAQLMEPLYRLLGLSVGTVTGALQDASARRAAYACDITYCTSKQLAFDYLRDRLVMRHRRGPMANGLRRLAAGFDGSEQLLLRGLCFAIVDEADSVLIDDAVTPLILSRERPASLDEASCRNALELAGRLVAGRDYRNAATPGELELSSAGRQWLAAQPEEGRASEFLVLQALRAELFYRRDRDYLVADGKVQIIDANTGRTLPDHSWEQGLQQLIEVREGCAPGAARETIARISYQRLFRRYLHLAGMTGTAREVSGEFWSVYGLAVVPVPTHAPVRRQAGPSQVFLTAADKQQAVLGRVQCLYEQKRPVLLATVSVAESEALSRALQAHGLPHQVLNARQNRREAEIIAAAGAGGAITIATNMAGRGTDIKLAPGVAALGGLHVIATACNESRRIDRQLHGRCARQGDPGSYETLLSLEDETLKKHLPQALIRAMPALCSRNVMLLRRLLVGLAQRRAERRHAWQRRQVMQYDQRVRETLAFSGPFE